MEYCDLKRDKATGKSKVRGLTVMCAVFDEAFGHVCRGCVCACEQQQRWLTLWWVLCQHFLISLHGCSGGNLACNTAPET
jgi:hypothetical protein